MSEELDEIRCNFRRETGRLTNWLDQPLRISDFCGKESDFYEEFKELCRRRREKEITFDEWHQLTGDLIRRYERGELYDPEA